MTGHSIVSPQAAKHATNEMVMISIYKSYIDMKYRDVNVIYYKISLNTSQYIEFVKYCMLTIKHSDDDGDEVMW